MIWIGHNWLTLGQGLVLQTIFAVSIVMIIVNVDGFTADLKTSIRKVQAQRWDKRDSMYHWKEKIKECCLKERL